MNVYLYKLLLWMGAWKDAPATYPFIIKHDWPDTVKTCTLADSLKELPLYSSPLWGPPRTHDYLENWTEWVVPKTKKYPSITGRLITQVHVKNWSRGFIVHTTTTHRPIRLLEFTWWLLFVIITTIKLPLYFGGYSLAVIFFCGYDDALLVRPKDI